MQILVNKLLSKKHLIIIAGPTAVGKTNLAIRLATNYPTDILSADSRQLYRELHIGVAKPNPEQLMKVKHHFIDHISISESYSVGRFESEALDILNRLFSARNLAVCCGGTGLYIDALRYGIDRFPPVDPLIRKDLEKIYLQLGISPLQKELQSLDPVYYQSVDVHNPMRLIRALSVIRSSGKTFSSFLQNEQHPRPFDCIPILLLRERQELYKRINDRVDLMLDQGLMAEAESLYPYKEYNALQTVGYKQLFDYMDGKMTKDEAIDKIKQKSRNYAKRQVTWFKKRGPWKYFHPDDEAEIIKYVEQTIQNR